MKYDIVKTLKEPVCTPFITIIGRSGAGIPVYRIEAIIEFNSEAAKNLFRNGLNQNKVVKTLLDESKIKSLVILDSGEIHPSTFHYVTLRKRCKPYITFATLVGCDSGGINIDKVHLIVNYKFDNSDEVVDELLSKFTFKNIYDDISRTRSLFITDAKNVYPCSFNFETVKRRIHQIRGDKVVEEDNEELEEDDFIDE